MRYKRLGDMLIDMGFITEEQLSQALSIQKETKQRLGQVLIENGFITEAELVHALEAQLGIDFIDLAKTKIDPALTALIPHELAESAQIVPVRLQKDTLYIAMADPMNFMAAEQAKDVSLKRIVPLFANEQMVAKTIDQLYSHTAGAEEASADSRHLDAAPQEDEKKASDTAAADVVSSMLEEAALSGGEEIYLEPEGKGMVVRMHGAGCLRELMRIQPEMKESVIAYLKSLAHLDINQKRLPQSGNAQMRQGAYRITLQISTLPTVRGEQTAVRILRRGSLIPSLDQIRLCDEEQQSRLRELLDFESGLILLTGPAGCGKTTTLYAVIKELAGRGRRIAVLEKETTFTLQGILQVPYEANNQTSAGDYMLAVRCQKPDLICIDDLQNENMVQAAVEASLTGVPVLAVLEAGSSEMALERLQLWGVSPRSLHVCLRGVISQRLLSPSGHDLQVIARVDNPLDAGI